MRRTSLVLAVVAAMVTVLVFTAPAFAVEDHRPAGPGGTNPETGGDNPPPENILNEGETPPQAPTDTVGGLATGVVLLDVAGHDIPPGWHIVNDLGQTPGELVQQCSDLPNPIDCLGAIPS